MQHSKWASVRVVTLQLACWTRMQIYPLVCCPLPLLHIEVFGHQDAWNICKSFFQYQWTRHVLLRWNNQHAEVYPKLESQVSNTWNLTPKHPLNTFWWASSSGLKIGPKFEVRFLILVGVFFYWVGSNKIWHESDVTSTSSNFLVLWTQCPNKNFLGPKILLSINRITWFWSFFEP